MTIFLPPQKLHHIMCREDGCENVVASTFDLHLWTEAAGLLCCQNCELVYYFIYSAIGRHLVDMSQWPHPNHMRKTVVENNMIQEAATFHSAMLNAHREHKPDEWYKSEYWKGVYDD